MKRVLCAAVVLALAGFGIVRANPGDVIRNPYDLDPSIESRSISYENPTGEKGAGGKAASKLGVGRKGSPAKTLKPGEISVLCDIQGPGCIRHIWMTTRGEAINLRSMVVRAWWDGQEHPSIECPLGDFMGIAHGQVKAYQSAVHSVGERAGMNIWLPMPFAKRAKFTMTNEGEKNSVLFYQIDYTIGDKLPDGFGRLHVLFRRENPTTMKEDFELLPKRAAPGRFIGSIIGIRALEGNWWGEGEIKVYLDGDTDFPTICGTGSEDYVGLSWGIQQTPFLYNGCSLNEKGYVCMYRWHLPDPILWKKDARITIQQIGYRNGLYERKDDWSCATFWYEPVPSAALPPMPDAKARTADVVPPAPEKK
ncbi:MAG: DUF2961 domain-containing protein [Planctomycetes bacterium]|nr:DUF2961 domain-containing protein [Planctomycetota bacterium]